MKGIFQLMGWLFTITSKYEDRKRSHCKYGLVGKIFSFLLLIVLIVATIGLTYLSAKLFAKAGAMEFGLTLIKIIGGITLALCSVTMAIAMYEYLIFDIILAFKCLKPKDALIVDGENKEIVDEQTQTPTRLVMGADKIYSKTSRAFDITLGILNLVLLIGLTAGLFFAIGFGFSAT